MKKPRFLHLIPDDKFIDGARELFEETAPGQHDFLLLSHGSDLRFIRNFMPIRLDVTQAIRAHGQDNLSSYDAVFIHYLNSSARLFVDSAPVSTRFIWLGWGKDYYHLISAPDELLMPATKALLKKFSQAQTASKLASTLRSIRRGLANPLWGLRRRASLRRLQYIGPNRQGENDLLARLELFAPVLAEDYGAVVRNTPNFHPHFAQWNYPCLATGRQSTTQCVEGFNILIGNSATPENNHIDTFKLIEKSVGSEQTIICPLSYGIKSYGDLIESAGYKTFGSRFRPLRQFMKADSYNSILSTCSVVAMNHIRQQAVGSILMMLWRGARIFLNHRSPIIPAMKNIGISVFDIRALPDFLYDPQPPLSQDQLMDIRQRLTNRYGHNALLKLTDELLTRSMEKTLTSSPHFYRVDELKLSEPK